MNNFKFKASALLLEENKIEVLLADVPKNIKISDSILKIKVTEPATNTNYNVFYKIKIENEEISG
ncbi:MAG: hypothetical protein IJB98_01910, partial [Clostridia bacterium]|nr:hypothetical protein [Clostridia bacterium]